MELQYRALVDQSLVGIYLISGDRFLYVNQTMADLYGYTREEMMGSLRPRDVVHPDDRHLVEANIQARLERQVDALRYTARALRKDGRVIHCEVFGRTTEWEGQPAIIGTLIDVTEQKRAELAGRENLETLQAVIAASPVAIYILDAGGLVRMWNPAAERTFGWSASETLGQFLPIVPSDKTDEFDAYLRRALNGELLMDVEVRRRRKDGSPADITLSTAPLHDSAGKIRGVVSLAMDITRRKQSEEAARESRELMQAVIQSAPIVIYALDRDGRVVMWNPGAERTFGWSQDEVLGQPLPTVPADQRAGFQQLLERAQRGEELRRVEVRRQRKGNEPVDLLLSTAALRGTDGQSRGSVHLALDITEQKKLEEQFRQAQKLESIGQLAGGVAHDFNNLLSVIIGRSAILLDQLPADAPHRRALELIQRTGERAAILTKQLLAFSRRQVLEPKVLDVNDVVDGIVPMLKRLISEDLELAVQAAVPLDRVRIDRGQLEQIIMNLVVNARDAMPAGGQITLETGNVVLSEDYARQHVESRPGPHVMLAVTDTGIGMDRATQARIFEPFFTTKELGKGTGLGLATVYGIVKQSGGSIWVYSELGQGTTFKVYLPRVEEAVETAAPPAVGTGRGTETILVAEDEDEVRSLVREILVTSGYTVLEAARPTDALQIAEQYAGAIHLLLTDVVMPQMSGRQLADRVAGVRPDTRILYMSGYPGETIVRQGRLEPGTPYLPKPIMPGALLAKIREVLDARQVR